MKFILLLLVMISALSCASHEKQDRDPASVEDKTDVTRGINTDFYGGAIR